MKLSKLPVRVTPLLLVAALTRPAAAQTLPERMPEAPRIGSLDDTTQVVDLGLLPDSLAAVPLDSAKLAWMQTPPELRDLIGDRIACLETEAPRAFNPQVMAFVTYFTQRNRKYTQRVLERENLYFPLFEKYLTKYNLPIELKYLAVVESALIPTAKSRVGATGLWQFMGPTAGDLRLRRDEWVDERMSPEKSTEAACKHLRYLYGIFHDWELVLAAYNWGAGNMQRVIRRTGKKSFWELYPHLPKETRNYVPTFTAIMYAMQYAQAHQLHSPELQYQYAEPMDTLQVAGQALDLRRLSQACGLSDSAALLRYNPELRRGWLPAGYRPYAVQVPANARPQLAVVDRATLFDYCRPQIDLLRPLAPLVARLNGMEPFPTRTMVASGAPREEPEGVAPRSRRMRHTVRRGETAAKLASRYDVTTAQLARWNGLRAGRALVPGQQLVVFVPVAAPAIIPAPAVASASRKSAVTVPARLPLPPKDLATSRPEPTEQTASATEDTSALEPTKPTISSARRSPHPTPSEATAATPKDSLPTTYTVRRGDKLSTVAQSRGLSVAQVMEWNQLDSEQVVPGQKLMLAAPEPTEEEAAAVAVAPRPKKAAPVSATPKIVSAAISDKVHLVQKGDTLYNISRRYQGVTVDQLRRLNNLTSDAVKPGQKLIVAR
jgi:membrane-bound lytic murein transglycosylase D